LARAFVDGRFTRREVEARKGEVPYSAAAQNLEVIRRFNLCMNLDTIGHVGVVACLLDTIGIIFAISYRNHDGFTIWQ
jgi:hypothetical protein